MNKEQEELLGAAYKRYLIEDARILPNMSKEKMTELGFRLTKEEFINKCKTDNEFSEMWGLKIEERELSLEERATIWNNTHNPVGNIYTHNQYDENDIPTKLITISYNDKTIESYE
jgi:hypothetical protein